MPRRQPASAAPPQQPAAAGTKLMVVKLTPIAAQSLRAVMTVMAEQRPDMTTDDAISAALNTLAAFLDFRAYTELAEEGGK